ncbi:MAG: BON domain-containing protein [Holosporales bacterium]|nr:BON domain-containing protein [Holosporales bacterium]
MSASVALNLSGCVPVLIGGGFVAGGYTAMRDKKIGSTINDTKLDAAIKTRLYKISPKLYSDVSVVVDHGCVLLTGSVSDPEWVVVAERESWAVDGVVAVDNNITHGEAITTAQTVKDGYITSVCRTSLMCTSGVRSVNYKLKTMNNIVYVRGVSKTEEEKQLVLAKLQKVRGIKKVVSYVTVSNRK